MTRSITVFLISAMFVFSCGGPPQPPEGEQADEGVAISVQRVDRQTMPVELSVRGNIRPWEQALITGAAGTRIEQILVEEGDRVSQGRLLVRMNDAELEQAQARLQLARTELQRMDTLLKIGSVSQQQFDQAQTEYQNALSSYNMLRENIRLVSPISGIVTDKYFLEGEAFSPSADAPSILTVMQLDPVKMVVSISEQYYSRINEGMEASVSVSNYPDTTFQGNVYRKNPVISEASRTFEVEISVDNEDLMLRPGMYGQVRLALEERAGLYIPVSAVVQQPGTSNQYVYIIQNDTARRKSINTGVRIQDMIQVESGLAEGETVATEGVAKLEDGAKVRVMEEES